MKLAVLSTLSFALLAVAHDVLVHHVARQDPAPPPTPAPPPSPPASTSPSPSVPSPPATGIPTATGTVTGTASGNITVSGNVTISLPPTVPVTLISTNPTAVPLTEITANASASPTIPLATVYAPGSIPTAVSNAPPLPDPLTIRPVNYPPLDKAPPTDSPEVQQWIQDVMNTGVEIPGFNPTTGFAACAANAQAASDSSRCWWTCGGCTRDSDVTTCPDPLTWGLTYDDGPAHYTPNLLNYLDEQQLKTTFFVLGSRALQFPQMLQTEYMGGHQIGVHTWSHTPLTTQTNEQIIAELGWTKKVIKDVLGVTPNTFRPPYGDIDDRVRAIAAAMGLTPVIWTRMSPMSTFDTGDFNINGGTVSVSQVISNFNDILGNASSLNTGFIVLEHDLFQQSVEVATGYILPQALAHQPKFQLKPVINCLNQPLNNAYIETNDNNSNPPPSIPGPDGTVIDGSSVQGGDSSSATSIMGDSVAALLSSGAMGLLTGFGALLL